MAGGVRRTRQKTRRGRLRSSVCRRRDRTAADCSLLSAREVANLLGVPASWVYEQSRRGAIPTVTLGRYRRYRREAITAASRTWRPREASHCREAPAGLRHAGGGSPKLRILCAHAMDERLPLTENGDVGRRSYGTGSLFLRRDAGGRESWYAKWRVGDRQVKRTIGLARRAGSREGLTRAQAERELRRRMEAGTRERRRGRAPQRGGDRRAADRASRVARAQALHAQHLPLPASNALGATPRRPAAGSRRAPPRGAPRRRHAPGRSRAKGHGQRAHAAAPALRVRPAKGMVQRQPCKRVERPKVEQSADIRLVMDEVERSSMRCPRALRSALPIGPST